jgi:DNA-binding beta-propeller fold protein YncE
VSRSRVSIFTVMILGTFALAGCGGGGTSSSPPPSGPPSFTISVTPASLSLAPGTSASATISLQTQNGFSGTPTVTLSGLPAGVTTSPAAPFSLGVNGMTLQFTASSSATDGNSAVSIQAASGTLSASASESLAVAPPASFSVLPSKDSLTVHYGSSISTSIGFAPGTGAKNYELALSASGIPDGVTAAFSPNPVDPSSTTTLTFATPVSALGSENAQITVTATRSLDGVQHQGQVSLSITLPPGELPSSRTEFVRTDDTPSSVVYDPVHDLVFACNPNLSRLDVISPTSRKIVKSIPLPGARGLSLTPDNSQLFVSGSMQQVAWVDTSSLAVVKRAVLPLVEPCTPCSFGYPSVPFPAVTSSGRVLFIGSIPGFYDVMDWDPSAGTIVLRPEPDVGQSGFMTRSADGTKILISDGSTTGLVTLYDAATDSFPLSRKFNSSAFAIAANPHGTQFAVAVDGQPVYILDGNLNTIGTAPASGLITGMVYSPDGSQLYIVNQPYNVPVISTISTQTLQLTGTAPAYASGIAYFTRVPPLVIETPMGADGRGTVFGVADHGVAIDDSTFYQNFSASTVDPRGIIAAPAEGPTNLSTLVALPTSAFTESPNIWFGELLGTNTTLSGLEAQASAPPSSTPGPVNVRIFTTDGTLAIIPQAFTYGEYAVSYGTVGASPSGGPTADFFGYGYSVDVSGASVQIGGNNAPVTHKGLYPGENPYPFPLQHLQVTIPAGSAGTKDLAISSPSGTTTVSKGFHYLESLKDYSTSDSLVDVLYDQPRKKLYLSAGNHVDVFSLSSSTFVSPISPPSLSGSYQLGGMALTPDGSELLVANFSDNSLAIINTDSPASASVVHIVPSGANPPYAPVYVAATSRNTAFVGCTIGGIINGEIYELDLGTHTSTLQMGPDAETIPLEGNVISSSKDGSIVFLSQDGDSGGPVMVWTAAAGGWPGRNVGDFVTDSAVSGDGHVLSAIRSGAVPSQGIRFMDTQMNIVGTGGLPEFLNQTYAQGERLHDSGSLEYVPFQQGIDIFDVHHGDLRERLLFTQQLSSNIVHPMALDETGGRIFLITNTGLTIAQLDSVPLSIGSVSPGSGAAGTQVTLRGSGFVPGAAATANGIAATVSFVDADTLNVTLPSLPAGAVQITLTNSDGQTYSLDDAYQVQ